MAQRPNTSGAVGDILEGEMIPLAFIIRLDIEGDPLFAWTGFGDLAFGAGETGDEALDGQTFEGITHLVAEIGVIQDSQGGSGALEISLPGVDLEEEAMRQVVYNQNAWQFKPAWVWLAVLDDNGSPIGTPIRLKSGRIDQMPVEETEDGQGSIRCIIESHQAYGSEALATRYSEQQEINPADTSQKWVWQLANMTPGLGQPHSMAGGSGSPSSPGGGGGGGGSGSGSGGGGGGGGNRNVNLY
jgi:hypothetical protein